MDEIRDNNLSATNNAMLFTRLAENEINNGNIEKAIGLLSEGIQKYSNYPSSYLLYGEALLTIGKVKEAKNAFQTGVDFLGFQATSNHYLNLIPEMEDDIPSENTDVEIHTNREDFTVVDSDDPYQVEETSEADDLVELADKLSSAKMDMPQLQDAAPESISPPPSSSGRSLVSETLARIYFSQENYIEAKEIYHTLIEIQPEREDYYRKKLDEINLKLEANS